MKAWPLQLQARSQTSPGLQGIVTLAALATFVLLMLWRERRSATPAVATPGAQG